MIRFQDTMLLAVVFASILAAVLFPRFSAIFVAFPFYCMMALLFLSFLSIHLPMIWRLLKDSPGRILYLLFLKLVLVPGAIYFLFRLISPRHALAALLVSGISTAAVSPFFAGQLAANGPLVVVMVVGSSLLVPLTLPALVKTLAGSSMQIPFWEMAKILGLVVFVPFVLAELVKRFAEGLGKKLIEKRFPVSLVIFSLTNLGSFGKYAHYLRRDPGTVAAALAVCLLLGVIFFAAGILFSWKKDLPDQLSILISFGLVNNILVLVFSSELFGPVEPTVAAMYTIPLYIFFPLLRRYKNGRSEKNGGPQNGIPLRMSHRNGA